MFYVGGDYMARKGSGIDVGSISLHPAGFIHGPQPGAVEASIGKEDTEEFAVMIDTFRPLELGEPVFGLRGLLLRLDLVGTTPVRSGVMARPEATAGNTAVAVPLLLTALIAPSTAAVHTTSRQRCASPTVPNWPIRLGPSPRSWRDEHEHASARTGPAAPRSRWRTWPTSG